MATEYGEYQQLDESHQQIRLMTIHPPTGTDDILTCTLEAVALRDANPFYALSYVWGPETPAAPISLNGQIVHLRQNLWNFLRVLRDQFCRQTQESNVPTAGLVRVWTDYICIEQSDAHERSSQVSMMGEIYRNADAVYAWLGEMGEDSMRCVTEAAAMRKQGVPWTRIARNLGHIETRLRDFTNSEYWTRMWIKQEVLLARDLWLCHNLAFTHWKDFAFLLKFFPKKVSPGSVSKHIEKIHALFSLMEHRGNDIEEARLCDLVSRFADSQCADPRDRLYALLALTDRDTRRQIVVDYTKPTFQVLLENYSLWTESKSTMTSKNDPVLSNARVYELNDLRENFRRIIPNGQFDTIRDSEENRRRITAQGIFAARDVCAIEGIFLIANMNKESVQPVSCVHAEDDEADAFVLRLSLWWSKFYGPRQIFVYSKTVPTENDFVVCLDFTKMVLFLRLSPTGTKRKKSLRDLVVIGHGTRDPAMNFADHGTYDRHKALSLQHPCEWLSQQLPDVRFEISRAKEHDSLDDLAIICNAAAMLQMLHGKHRTEEAYRWQPFSFGLEHEMWQPYPFYRPCSSLAKWLSSARRFVATELTPRRRVYRESFMMDMQFETSESVPCFRSLCFCQWIRRSQCSHTDCASTQILGSKVNATGRRDLLLQLTGGAKGNESKYFAETVHISKVCAFLEKLGLKLEPLS